MSRVFSFGGGVQSTAALVLAAQGKIDFRVFLFANVGEDSENPDTLAYIPIAKEYAKNNSLELHEVRRTTNNGESLYQRLLREDHSIGIPIRMPNGAPGSRNCTKDYKRDVIRRWLGKGDHVVGIGFSLDEFTRMRTDSGYKNIVNEYPLIDLRISRADCLKIINDAGLPRPPKSSCWFCPFHNTLAWQELKRNKPELFYRAAELESLLNQKREKLGRDSVWLTRRARPISDVIGDQPLLIPEDDDNCESGYCMV